MEILGVEVHLNTNIDDPRKFGRKSDIIIATGSKPRILKGVPGHEKMIEACEFLRGAEVGQKVAVIGGGLTGCEIAYELALMGKEPIIVEMKDDLVSQTGVCLANSSYLREYFALHKTPVYLETSLKEVRDGSIICTDKDGKELEMACDSVISSAGYIPDPVTKENDRTSNMDYVGDCQKIGNLRTVIWRAYEVAMRM
jgi:2-enoate reductase